MDTPHLRPKRKLSETTTLSTTFSVPFEPSRSLVSYKVIQDLHYSQDELFNFRTVSSTAGFIAEPGGAYHILFAATTKNSVFILKITKGSKRDSIEEHTIPLVDLSPTAISLYNGLMAVGFANGGVELFDPLLIKTDILKLNSEGALNHKGESVDLIRFVPKTTEVLVIFSDASMHCYKLLSSTSSPQEIINQLREIEGISFDSKAAESLPSSTDSVQYEFHLDKDGPAMSFAVALSEYDVSPRMVWKFFNQVQELKFNPASSTYFALAAKDPFLRIFNFAERRLAYTHRSYYGNILCLDYSADGKLLAAGAEDDSITIYNVANNSAVCRCTGHRSFISSVRFDPTYDAQLNSAFTEEISARDIEKGLENIQKNYKLLSEAELLAAVRKSHMNEESKDHSNKKIYRLISTGHDCMISMWDIDLSRVKSHNDFQLNKVRRKSSVLPLEDKKNGELSSATALCSDKPISKDYPSLFAVYNLGEPLIRERVHGNPIVRMETVKSFIFTISLSGNFRLFKPTIALCRTLVEDALDEDIEEENPQLDIKLSNFRTKHELDGYFSSGRSPIGISPKK